MEEVTLISNLVELGSTVVFFFLFLRKDRQLDDANTARIEDWKQFAGAMRMMKLGEDDLKYILSQLRENLSRENAGLG